MEQEGVEPSELVADLEARLESGSPGEKVAAMKALRGAVDPLDATYAAQRDMAAEGAVELLVKLLGDETEAVACEAALSLAALTSNSQGVGVRLERGRSFGLSDRADQLMFNPIQGALEEAQGIRKLVNMLYLESSGAQEAAQEALMSAGSFNHDVKLAYLKCLVHDLREGNKASLSFLDRLISSMEIRDSAAVVLDQAILPVLAMAKDDNDKLNAVTVLGTISEERPAAGAFLCDEGALMPVAQMIISGEPRQRDAGVHTMWHMIKKNKAVLQPGKDMLGVEGSALVQPLADIIQSSGVESDTDEKSFDNSDEALLILKALAEQDPSVRGSVKELDLEPSMCSLM